MLIGYGIFSLDDLGVFQTNNSIGTFQSVKLENGKYDELHIRSTTSGIFSTNLDNWTPSTVLLAKFQNNLSAGNVSINGMTVENLIIKRRKVNELIWNNVCTIPFSQSTSIYSYIDKFVEAQEEYEYCVIPTTSGIEGDYSLGQITTQFDGAFLISKDFNYQLLYNFELGDVQFNSQNSTIEPLGATYPIIMINADLQYKSGSVKAMLVSNTTVNANGINASAEKIYRKNLMDFLTNKKPKILKSTDGLYCLISIVGTPKLRPYNDLNCYIYDVNFDFVEIGNALSNDDLTLAGII